MTAAHPAVPFALPPALHDARGVPRRVGIEVEFTGLSVRAAAFTLCEALGGSVVEEDPHAFAITGTRLGDLAVELDIRYAHARAASTTRVRLGPGISAWLGRVVDPFVPRELVTAPLPLTRLAAVDEAVAVLRRAGAKGKGATWWGSLGLHFNVDPPGLEVAQLLPVLRAYLVLEPWLRAAVRATSSWPATLARPFPQAYVRQVLAEGYEPGPAELVADYLAANPTRDRGLDLLPILLHLAPAQVRGRLPHAKIGRQPVLHVRLPLAFPGDPAWSIAPDWNRWVAVEHLAADPARLACAARAMLRDSPVRPVVAVPEQPAPAAKLADPPRCASSWLGICRRRSPAA